MVYWGTPKYDEPIHNSPQIVSPGLLEGADLSKLYFSLRSIGNGLIPPYTIWYMPSNRLISARMPCKPHFRA